jgi:hypothetical protein
MAPERVGGPGLPVVIQLGDPAAGVQPELGRVALGDHGREA